MTIDAFFNALVEARPDEGDLADRLRRRHEELLGNQQHRVIDEASVYNLSLTLAVLAAYQELGDRQEDDELVPLLTRAFVEPMSRSSTRRRERRSSGRQIPSPRWWASRGIASATPSVSASASATPTTTAIATRRRSRAATTTMSCLRTGPGSSHRYAPSTATGSTPSRPSATASNSSDRQPSAPVVTAARFGSAA